MWQTIHISLSWPQTVGIRLNTKVGRHGPPLLEVYWSVRFATGSGNEKPSKVLEASFEYDQAVFLFMPRALLTNRDMLTVCLD